MNCEQNKPLSLALPSSNIDDTVILNWLQKQQNSSSSTNINKNKISQILF